MKNLSNHNIYRWPKKDNGGTALDNIDGVIPVVVVGDVVDINTPGAQVATYNVGDAAGNPAAQVNRMVNVTPDVMIPVITLSGIEPMHAEQGMPYDMVRNPGAKILPRANCVNSNSLQFRKRFFSYISAPGFGLYVGLYALVKWSVILIKPMR
jgi:hypothetical protein